MATQYWSWYELLEFPTLLIFIKENWSHQHGLGVVALRDQQCLLSTAPISRYKLLLRKMQGIVLAW